MIRTLPASARLSFARSARVGRTASTRPARRLGMDRMVGLLLGLGLAMAALLPGRALAGPAHAPAAAPAAAPADAAASPLDAAAQAALLLAEQAGAGLQDAAAAQPDGQGREGAPARRVEVVLGTLSPRLKLAPCAQIEPYLPPGFRAWGSTRVGLRCVDGPVRWNVFLPLTVHVWGEALVPAQPLPAGRVIESTDLLRAEVDLAALPSPALDDPALAEGRVLARSLAPGQALRAGDLKQRQWFASGETVQIEAQGPGFAVQARGQALNAGLDGRPVRVRMDNGRIVSGTAVGAGRVAMRL